MYCVLFLVVISHLLLFFAIVLVVFFFKQKTAYEMRISDWSSTCALPISTAIRAIRSVIRRICADTTTIRAGLSRPTTHIEREHDVRRAEQIGRASCRERVCQYV